MRAAAHAKLNLALVVGPLRPDGTHEVATVLQAIDLHDDVELEPNESISVSGFEDTLVTAALEALARSAGVPPGWHVRIEKRIPVAAGLGGGSSDAAAALRLANATLRTPLESGELHRLAASIGADVPFFLRAGPQLATGDGSDLEPIELPGDYVVLLVLPQGAVKESTRSVYERFDTREGDRGFSARRAQLLETLARVRRALDLASLPPNDLVASPVASELAQHGAFRADVTGAGPVVYGLFEELDEAQRAERALAEHGVTMLARPVAHTEHDLRGWQDAFALGRGQAVRQRVLVP